VKVSPLENSRSYRIVRGNPTKFNGFYQVWENFPHSVDPRERGEMTRCLVVDLVTNFEVVVERNRVPRDARDDDIPACSINNVGVYFKCREALPFPILLGP
jgi:hypothetical protein